MNCTRKNPVKNRFLLIKKQIIRKQSVILVKNRKYRKYFA